MLQIDANPNSDLTLDLFQTRRGINVIPEPVTAALGFMGMGAIGIATRRRRVA